MKNLKQISLLAMLVLATNAMAQKPEPEVTELWEPVPEIVTPGNGTAAPSDAIIIFDGKTLENFVDKDGATPKWTLADGAMTVKPGAGEIISKKSFGDMQMHIEWKSPEVITGDGQGRGNSGIFLMGKYEVQVLDCYNNKTYSNGQAASIYKQLIPLVNACRKPGEWQTYDIIFTAPRFNEKGRMTQPARITLLHNGVLVQNNATLWGGTEYIGLPKYNVHGAKEPFRIQDHGNLVSFRNIWVREL